MNLLIRLSMTLNLFDKVKSVLKNDPYIDHGRFVRHFSKKVEVPSPCNVPYVTRVIHEKNCHEGSIVLGDK
jgi:hypothetical protein